MGPIYLHPELATWAKGQVYHGVAPSVEALVVETIVARKKDTEWLDKIVSDALFSAEQEGWVEGFQLLGDVDRWICELDERIEELTAFRAERRVIA
jgi:hypothetical protein